MARHSLARESEAPQVALREELLHLGVSLEVIPPRAPAAHNGRRHARPSFEDVVIARPDRIELPLWDCGVRLYALPYYATTDTLAKNKDVLARFVRASAKGWAFAYQNVEKAVGYLLENQPELDAANAMATAKSLITFAYDETTRSQGWGAMSQKLWQDQIDLFRELGEFTARVPSADEVFTPEILALTQDSRPRLG